MERKFIDAGQLIREIKRMSRSDSSTREVHVMIIESHEAIVSHSIKDALQARNEVLVTFSQRPAQIGWGNYILQLLEVMGRG